MILAGILFLLFGWPEVLHRSPIRYEHLPETVPDEKAIALLGGYYQPDKLIPHRVSHENGGQVRLDTVHYTDKSGQSRSAIVFPPGAETGIGTDDDSPRMAIWREAASVITRNAPEQSLTVTWWDNAQRVDFLSGRPVWQRSPVAGAFPETEQRRFWERAGGGFEPDESRGRQLARWFSMDAGQALGEMTRQLPKDRPVYLLVTLDDLARLSEMESLTGTTFPFEVRVFPRTGDIHGQIAEVRRWAGEKGVESYLVQQLPTGDVRAWRITTQEGTGILLARLLPFTTSLTKPLDGLSLVFQSRWGGYLSIYQWRP